MVHSIDSIRSFSKERQEYIADWLKEAEIEYKTECLDNFLMGFPAPFFHDFLKEKLKRTPPAGWRGTELIRDLGIF